MRVIILRTLLIADDERIIRKGIAGSCNWESLEINRVLLAADGREAYELIKKESPDVVIIDIIMPEMTGFEVIAQCAKKEHRPEFIIISGYEEFHYAQEAIKYKVKRYLLKPCDPLEIETTVQEVIGELEQRREKSHLEAYLDLLVPEACEQLLRNYLLKDTAKDGELLQKVIGNPSQDYQLVLIIVDELLDYNDLHFIKKSLDAILSLELSWGCTAIIQNRIVLLVKAAEAEQVKVIIQKLSKMLPKRKFSGLKAILSLQGVMERLPSFYRDLIEASYRLSNTVPTENEIALYHVSTAQYSEPVRKIIDYVNQNLDNSSLSLNHVAANVLFHNPDYLGKLFKKECGMKFSDYLMQKRIERAKQIIASSANVKIYEVANKVGLGNSTAYFGQVFRKYTGMLPSEFRDSLG